MTDPTPPHDHVWARRRDGRVCVDCGEREFGEPKDPPATPPRPAWSDGNALDESAERALASQNERLKEQQQEIDTLNDRQKRLMIDLDLALQEIARLRHELEMKTILTNMQDITTTDQLKEIERLRQAQTEFKALIVIHRDAYRAERNDTCAAVLDAVLANFPAPPKEDA